MVKFGTQEWVDQYVDAINSNEAYAKAADWWEGDFVFQVDPHGGLTEQLRLWIGLHHGKCTGCKILKEDDEVKLLEKGESAADHPFAVEYIYAARIDVWEKIMKKELDPIRALLSGQAKLTGDMAKVLRATDAAKELVVSASTIETEFYD
jgi:putative sterol carrier protein